jgi:hypothetical protein
VWIAGQLHCVSIRPGNSLIPGKSMRRVPAASGLFCEPTLTMRPSDIVT